MAFTDLTSETKAMDSKIELAEPFTPKKYPQVLAAFAASFASFSLGAAVAWTSPSIPDLEKKGVLGTLSIEDKSWIASLVTLGALFCGPFSGYMVDKVGRRMSVMILAIPMIVGWVLISTGLSVLVMCIGRFLTGFSMGGNINVATIYVSEIAEERIRGFLVSITYIQCGLGILYIYVLGSFASWFVLSVTNIIFPVILLVGMYLVPESPIHLLNIGKKKEAIEALVWLRGADDPDQIQSELAKFQENCTSKPESGNDEGLIHALASKNALKALTIALALMMCQQMSGVNAVLFFSLTIFEAAGTGIDANLSSIIIGIVIMISVCFNTLLIDRAGRRVLMMISQLGMALAVSGIGIFFYLKNRNDGVTPEGLAVLPLVSLLAFMLLYNVGAGPIPFLMMGELLPSRIRGFGCALATSFNWLLAFIVTKTFESLTILLGIDGCFFLFAGICLLGLLFCALFVPETKGKSFDEIQKQYFSK